MKLILNKKKKAQSLIEYALILAMVAVVAVAALQLLGQNLGTALKNSSSAVKVGAENAGQNACEKGMGGVWDANTQTCNMDNVLDAGDSDGTNP